MENENQFLIKFLTFLNWALIGLSFVAFYFSLRSQTMKLQYAIAALVVWGLAYLVSRWVKKLKNPD